MGLTFKEIAIIAAIISTLTVFARLVLGKKYFKKFVEYGGLVDILFITLVILKIGIFI